MQRLGVIFLVLIGSVAQAQFTYTFDQSIPVENTIGSLSLAWAGGLNSAQFNTIDLNGDNQADLVVYDRTASRLQTFLRQENRYVYAPEYETQFPSQITHWMLLRDFDCDGRKDIFTSDPFGIQVFVNTTTPGQPLSWRIYNPGFPLLTKGFSGNINLKVNQSDIPAIDDVDGDGDLDILNVRFIGAGTVEWHKNLSMERTGTCDSLQLERVTQSYGGFEECSCGLFAFGTACPTSGGRTEHAGGKTLLTLDVDNDGDKEILFTEEECGRIFLLTNQGTKDNPLMTAATPFPPPTLTAFQFPAPFLEDVDFDGKLDLLASPNLYARTFTNTNFVRSAWLYKNTGTNQVPNFTFTQDNFLQGQMIDVGDYSVPAFTDADGDGDEDLFIGHYADAAFRAGIYFFENVGTSAQPSFQLRDDDFGFLRFGNFYNLKPQFADMNGDSRIDLAFTATDLQRGFTSLYYLSNMADNGLQVSLAQLVNTNFRIGQTENATIADIDQDGSPDVLVGTSNGAVHYYRNQAPLGQFNLVQESNAYLGLSQSTSRQTPALAISDLDADGRGDLVMADQLGRLSIIGDFRNYNPSLSIPVTEVFYNTVTEAYEGHALGARAMPTIVNLFNSDKPAIVVGNVAGGVQILKNNEGKELPPDPVVQLFPNPLGKGENLSIRADRNVLLQVYSVLGQKMSEPLFIPANQIYPLALQNMAAGLYIARFTHAGKSLALKFIIQ